MNDPGKLQGTKLVALFDELVQKKTIISIHVVGAGFERLTCIVKTEQDSGNNHLYIDRPEGFIHAAGKDKPWNLRFNFNGPDSLEYIFSTKGGQLSGREIRLPFPEYVERLQRRKDFRILTLPGTKLLFSVGKVKGIIDMINVSLGGAFGALRKHNQKDHTGSLLSVDQRLYKIGLIFPADKEMNEQVVVIDKAEIRRVEHDNERNLYKYAFEFKEIDKIQKQKLTQSIYHIQRHFLKNR